jgi:hypothetical protein
MQRLGSWHALEHTYLPKLAAALFFFCPGLHAGGNSSSIYGGEYNGGEADYKGKKY